jgi:hypothetical protein
MTLPLRLKLNLASFSPGARLAEDFLGELESHLQQTFDEACDGHLALTIQRRDPNAGLPSNTSMVGARELHDFALALNGNPEFWGHHRLEGPAVPAISAIFAEYYAPAADVLGVMFDRGFDTDDDGNDSRLYTGVPREACAIFVSAARDLRQNPIDTADEIWFTTTHELGHVFNLQHTFDEQTYLSQSPSDAPYHWKQVGFSPHQCNLLRQCDSSPQVWPGGSDFGDESPFGNHDRPVRPKRRRPLKNLHLKIGVAKHEFYRFEPVELDVSLTRSAAGGPPVPNCLDPGYKQFRIWIEEPNGERRLYRSPRHYCQGETRLRLDPGQTFRRDISVFGEAGGYTFRAPGPYQLTAELDLGDRGVVKSTSLSINILPYCPGKRSFDRALTLFGKRAAAHVLYHRAAPSKTRAMRQLTQLTELCDAHARVEGVESLRYAVGRAWLAEAAHAKDTQKKARALDAGVRQLRKSVQRTALGKHRIKRAENILTQLEQGADDLHDVLWSRRTRGKMVSR